jgi:hypothetical protein
VLGNLWSGVDPGQHNIRAYKIKRDASVQQLLDLCCIRCFGHGITEI